nr:HAMP domain-containing protein [Streptomyces scopuliridis]
MLLAAVLALLAAGTVLRPVRKLGRATRELAAGDLGSRVAVTGHDELGVGDAGRHRPRSRTAAGGSGAGLRPVLQGGRGPRAWRGRRQRTGQRLGTAIALGNARLHGGTIDVADGPRGGAVFTLRLPLRRTGEGAE